MNFQQFNTIDSPNLKVYFDGSNANTTSKLYKCNTVGFPASFTQCSSFTGFCRVNVSIKDAVEVVDLRKDGEIYYLLGKTKFRIEGAGTDVKCSNAKKLAGGGEHVLFKKQNNEWIFLNTVVLDFICYSQAGKNINCANFDNKQLPNGVYYKKNLATGNVEKITIGSNNNNNSNNTQDDDLYKKFQSEITKNENNKKLFILIAVVIVITGIVLVTK